MSTESVEKFFQKVSEDQALQTGLVTALEADNDREAVTQLANSSGFSFTADELWAEVQKRQSEFETRQSSGELSDEELETVAGGLTPAITFMVTLGVTAATTVGLTIGSATYHATKW